jgi:hypothetical protein
VLHVVFSGVMDIPPAERPGVEAVVIRRGGGGDNRTVQLRVAAHRDVKPAGAVADTDARDAAVAFVLAVERGGVQ